MARNGCWGELLDRIEASLPGSPAPYLHNELLTRWPSELLARSRDARPARSPIGWKAVRFPLATGRLS